MQIFLYELSSENISVVITEETEYKRMISKKNNFLHKK
jgi:hypothetical protein